jgi:hypothetical protein
MCVEKWIPLEFCLFDVILFADVQLVTCTCMYASFWLRICVWLFIVVTCPADNADHAPVHLYSLYLCNNGNGCVQCTIYTPDQLQM